MTIEQAISETKSSVPNTIENKTFIIWLSRLDHQMKSEVFDNYTDKVDHDGYDEDTPTDTELLVEPPYDELYIRYLEAQVYRFLGENTKYNDCISEFNSIYQKFQNQYNRNHTPKGEHRFHFYGG